jgi:hypothetical protein
MTTSLRTTTSCPATRTPFEEKSQRQSLSIHLEKRNSLKQKRVPWSREKMKSGKKGSGGPGPFFFSTPNEGALWNGQKNQSGDASPHSK